MLKLKYLRKLTEDLLFYESDFENREYYIVHGNPGFTLCVETTENEWQDRDRTEYHFGTLSAAIAAIEALENGEEVTAQCHF